MLPLENGVLVGLQRELKIKLNLPTPPMDQDQPDPAFLRATDWLLCEAGCDWLPNLASETRARPDVPARAALAGLLKDGQGSAAVGLAEWDAQIEPRARLLRAGGLPTNDCWCIDGGVRSVLRQDCHRFGASGRRRRVHRLVSLDDDARPGPRSRSGLSTRGGPVEIGGGPIDRRTGHPSDGQ